MVWDIIIPKVFFTKPCHLHSDPRRSAQTHYKAPLESMVVSCAAVILVMWSQFTAK